MKDYLVGIAVEIAYTFVIFGVVFLIIFVLGRLVK